MMHVDAFSRDLKFAFRLMARQPLLTCAAVLTIAFGVGANTAIYSVLQTVVLNPLGMRHTADVVVARVHLDKLRMRNAPDSGVEFRELHAMQDTFSAVAAVEGQAWTYQTGGQAVRLLGRAVTPEFFQVFAAAPALGRFLTADDRQSLVLSHEMWQTQFGGDPGVIGRAAVLDGKPYRIVGVAPRRFRFPADASAWCPLVLSNERLRRRGWNMNLLVLARLRPGITQQQAAGRINRYIAGVESQPGGGDLAKMGYGIDLDSLAVYIAGQLRDPLWLLWTAAFVVMLTGCANVAGLLLTRSAGRRKEMAVRLSVGATRWQIVRQLLLESVALGAMGGAAGLILARLAVALAARAPLQGRAVLELVSLDGRMLLYGMALAVGSALVFGLVPAAQILRESQTAAMVRSRRRRFQDLFVVAEVAGSFVLIVVTALLLRSLWNVEQIQLGLDPDHLTTAYITPQNDPGFEGRLLATLRSAPGVESAALVYPLPFSTGGLTSGFAIRNRQRRPDEPEWHGEAYFVSPDYLRTLRIPLLRGRNLSESDTAKAPLVCLIDRNLAERFFPNQDPIGQQIAMYGGWAEIAGVVANARTDGVEEVTRPVVYYSLTQVPLLPQRGVVVRSAASAANLIRQAVRRTNASVPVFDVRTMEQRIGESLGIRRVLAMLLAVFGGIGLLLAAIGIYGVIAQVVAERTQEVGIRMALGARPGQILAQFTRQGLRAGAVGLVFGVGMTAYARKWVASFLYQVRGFDAATVAFAAAGILAVLLAASWIPARRAAKIDPQTALRHE